MKKLLSTLVLVLAIMCIFTACDLLPTMPNGKEDAITIEGGYLVVNGVKTDYQIKTDDVVEVVDGYVVVNGIKTQHQVKTEDVIEVIDGYVVVNGNKTDHKVHTEPVVEVIDGYVAVNGVKTQYQVKTDDIIEVIDGYVYVNGVKTDHKVHTEPVVEVIDGYVAVNGVKTQYQVKTEDVIEVVDGYVYVNGVKTEIFVPDCNHSWTTVTTKPTCTAGGYDTKTCTLCGKSVTENETAKLDHNYADTYSFDDNNHWFKCTGCGAKKDVAIHVSDANNSCTVCGTILSATPGVMYDISNDGTYAEVIGYVGTDVRVKIASVYEGLPVTNIYGSAFKSNRTISEVIIPDSVTSIGSYAFAYSSIRNVTIGNSVTYIGDAAFESTYLREVVIPNSVTVIENWVFRSCTSLTNVTMGENVKTIGQWVFIDCYSLNFVEYEGCKYLSSTNNTYFALIDSENKNLSSYTIHKDTGVISNTAFSLCSRFKDAYYGGSEAEWAQVGGKNNVGYGVTIHYNYVHTP